MSRQHSTGSPAKRLLKAVRDLLAAYDQPLVGVFLSDWPAEVGPMRELHPRILPVLAWLETACRAAAKPTAPVAELLAHNAAMLSWGQTYTEADFGTEFLARYGWTELIGLRGPVASDRIACGFLLLGPETEYPCHSHEAEELYLPLSGTADWMRDGIWSSRVPGTLIHHTAWMPHAMRTSDQPLLALYLWRAGDLVQKPRIG